MNEIQQVARRALAARVLAEAAKEIGAPSRERTQELMHEHGSERLRVRGDDDETGLGTVSWVEGSLTVRVADEEAFRAWVRKHHPDRVQEVTTEVVDPVWLSRLLAAVQKTGRARDGDTDTDVPGLEITQGAPYISVRPNAEARRRMREVLARSGLLEIEAGDGDAAP